MNLVVKHFSELSARMAVFIVEQNCAEQDIDDFDTDAYHLYLEEDGIPHIKMRLVAAH